MNKQIIIEEVIKDAYFKDEEIEQPAPIITIDKKVIGNLGNFICISGLPKSRKTTFASYMIASAIKREPVFNMYVNLNIDEKILLIDTEQSIYDFSKQIKFLKYTLKVKKLPQQFKAYLFRKYEPDTILNAIYTLVKEQRPKIIFIDNLTELVINPNDMVESKKVIQFLKLITAEFNLLVVCLLHLSKSNLQTLGNLGSYTDRGAQSVLKVTLDKETGTSTLEAQLMRSDSFFNPISIGYNEDTKNYEQVEHQADKPKTKKFILMNLTAEDHNNRLNAIFFTQKLFSYEELIEEIKKIYGVGTNISKQQILPYLRGNNFLKQDANKFYHL